MNKLQTIITEVAADVTIMMENAILNHSQSITYERQVGDAYIDIRIYESFFHNHECAIKEVDVNHIDTKHHSPRIEEAIMKSLPNWMEMKHEIFWEGKQTA